MRVRTFCLAALALSTLVSCSDIASPVASERSSYEKPVLLEPTLRSLIPSAGSTISAGATLSAEVQFSAYPSDYPMETSLIFWTTDGIRWGEGRGCPGVKLTEYRSVQTVRCEFYLSPLIYGWWKQDRVIAVDALEFYVTNAAHDSSTALYRKRFPLQYYVR